MDITLYGAGTTRSSRCRWTLLELGLNFTYIDDASLIGTDKLALMHPLGKLPVIVIDENTYFESAAICSHLCELHPEKQLIANSGSHQRGLHNQWCSFALSEIEAYLWSSLKNEKLYPKEKRVTEILPNNTGEIRQGLQAIEAALESLDYLTGHHFSVTDIVVGFTINWAKNAGHLEKFPNLSKYLGRLHSRSLCTFRDS